MGDLAVEVGRAVVPVPTRYPMALTRALQAEEETLEAEGTDPVVAVAYLTMAPLLWEEKAIAAHVRHNPELMGALPNVVDVGEAVIIATKDYRLNAPQREQLAALLQTPPQ